MSQTDRDLVLAIRAELAAIDPARPCDRVAESIGLGSALAAQAAVARLAVRLGRGTADAGRDLTDRRRTKHIRVLDQPSAVTSGAESSFAWATSPEHCRLAYLRGRFLARGSLSLASSRSHLEFVVPPDEAPILAGWLAGIELPASWRIRRGRGVVTWKSSETIGTFLRRIGAGASLLELEARQVSRAMRGDMNRVINAESANLQRAVTAAGRQLEAIDVLDADGRLGQQPYLVRVVAAARRETPEATFAELAEHLALHRSSVQRALERVERLALHPDDGVARSSRRRPNVTPVPSVRLGRPGASASG